jgi:hypothetical protein
MSRFLVDADSFGGREETESTSSTTKGQFRRTKMGERISL